MRVYDLAIVLGVKSTTLVQFLRLLGVIVRSPSAMVEPILAQTVIAHFGA